jgi:hypothetical protein
LEQKKRNLSIDSFTNPRFELLLLEEDEILRRRQEAICHEIANDGLLEPEGSSNPIV